MVPEEMAELIQGSKEISLMRGEKKEAAWKVRLYMIIYIHRVL